MAELADSGLDAKCQKLAENARTALERGNLDYAIEACAEVLAKAPDCVAVRRLQRIAQLKRFRGKGRWATKGIGCVAALRGRICAQNDLPEERWRVAERWLASDPTSVAALMLFGAAAMELGRMETAVWAFAAVRELKPEDGENLMMLGRAWLANGRPTEALQSADAVLAKQPVNAAALDLMRRASIAEAKGE